MKNKFVRQNNHQSQTEKMDRIFCNQKACDVMIAAMKKHLNISDELIARVFQEASWSADPMSSGLKRPIQENPPVVGQKSAREYCRECAFCHGKDHSLKGCLLQAHKQFFDNRWVQAIPQEPRAYLMGSNAGVTDSLVFVFPKGMFPIVVGWISGNPNINLLTLKQSVSRLDLDNREFLLQCPIEYLTPSLGRDMAERDSKMWNRVRDAGLVQW
jgi:hypothetical protein